MRPLLVLVLLGLACQNILANPLELEEPDFPIFDNSPPSLAFLEEKEAESKALNSNILSSYEKILEKLTNIECQIARLQKDAQPIQNSVQPVEEELKPTEGPVTEIEDESLLENFEKIGSKYYHIGDDETLDWHDALAKCKSLDGNLLSLKNEGEWQAIAARLDRQKSYWVDINDREEEGEFISETSGKIAPYFKWDISEPNNLLISSNNENCVELRSGYNHYMNDISCYSVNNYVCEANMDSVNIIS